MDDKFQPAASAAPAPSAPPAPASQPVTLGATIGFDCREGLARGVVFDHRVDLNTNGVAKAIALDAILRIDTNLVYVGTNAVEILPAVVPTEPAVTTP
jgi:hypothetical protein